MANKMNDLKGILFLVLFAVPMISSANINCSGKAFHCVNSTHFMICVDLGGGVSTTIDDFIIPCPPTTVCHEQNIFECEFPKIEITTPQLNVIGDSLQREVASVTTSLTNSETVSKLPGTTPSVMSSKENVAVTTLPVPEEVISPPEVDILDSLKQNIGVEHNKSTDAVSTIHVTSNSTYSANEISIAGQINQNIIKNTEFDSNNSNMVESAAESSKDKAGIASLIDIFTFKDTMNKNNTQSVGPNMLTALNTSDDNNTTTIDQYITKQVRKNDDKVNNVTDEYNKLKGIIEIKQKTPIIYIQTKSQSSYKDDINNQNIAERNVIGEITITDPISEGRTKINTTPVVHMNTKSFLIDKINQNITEINATGETTFTDQITETRIEISTKPIVNVPTQSFKFDINNQTSSVIHNIAERNTISETTTTKQKPVSRTKTNTTFVVDMHIKNFITDDINNPTDSSQQNITERNDTVDVTTANQELQTIIEISTTPTVNVQTQSQKFNDVDNKTSSVIYNISEHTIGETTTTVQLPETRIENSTTPMMKVQTQTLNMEDISYQTNSGNQYIVELNVYGDITTTEKIPETRVDINTTPTVKLQNQSLYIENINNQTNSGNQTIAERNAIGEITTTEQIPETRTEKSTAPTVKVQTQTLNIDDINNQTSSGNQYIADQNAIGEIITTKQIPITRTKNSTAPTVKAQTQTLNIDDTNNQISSGNQYIADQNAIGEITTSEQITETRIEISTTPMVKVQTLTPTNNQTGSVPQNITERNVTGEITTTDQIPETTAEVNTTPTIYMYTQTIDINYINNQTSSDNQQLERISTGEITTADQVPETRIEISTRPTVNVRTQILALDHINNQTSLVIHNIAEPNIIGDTTTTEQIPEIRIGISTIPGVNVQTRSLNNDDINNNQTNLVDQNFEEQNVTHEMTTFNQLIETKTAHNTTPISNGTNSNNQNFVERNANDEIITTDQILETGTKYLASHKMNAILEPVLIVESPQETTEKTYISSVTEEKIMYTTKATYYTILDESIGNDSILIEKTTIGHNLETSEITDTPIISTYETNQINKTSLTTKNNADENNNTKEPQVLVYNASSVDSFIEKVTEPTLFRTPTIEEEEVINTIAVSLPPFSVDTSYTNVKAETVINTDTNSAPYNGTVNYDRNIALADLTQLTNASSNITSDAFVRNTSNNHTSLDLGETESLMSLENKYQGVMNQPSDTETITLSDKVNNNETTKTVPDHVDKRTIYWTNVENIATTPYPRETSKTTISVAALALQKSNSINQNQNLTHALTHVETVQSLVPKTNMSQRPPLNQYATGFTFQTPEVIDTTKISMDSVRKVPSSVSAIVDINSSLPTKHTVLNEKDTNLNKSNLNDSGNKDTTISTVDFNKEVIKTTMINSINGINIESTSPSSTFNHDGFATKVLTNGTLKLFSLNNKFLVNSTESNKTNPLLLDADIKITTLQDIGATMSTSVYNVANEFSKVSELNVKQLEKLPNHSLMNEYSVHQTLTDPEVSTKRVLINDVHTENVKETRNVSSIGIGIEEVSSSTIKYDTINLSSTPIADTISTVNTDILILSKGVSIDHTILPDTGIEPVTTRNSFNDNNSRHIPGSVDSTGDFTKSTISLKSSTQFNSPPIINEEVKSNNVQLVKELPLFTTTVIERQTVYRDVPTSSPQILKVPKATAEPAQRHLFPQTTLAPIAMKNRMNVSPTFITTKVLPISTNDNFNLLPVSDKITESVINSVVSPDFIVENGKVNQDKIRESKLLANKNLSEVILNNQTTDNSNYSDKPNTNIDHENIITEFSSKNSKNMTNTSMHSLDTVNSKDMVNTETQNEATQTIILTDSDKNATDKIIDYSINGKSSYISPTQKSIIDQIKVLPNDSPLAARIGRKVGIDTVEYESTTSWSYLTDAWSATPKYYTQSKGMMTNGNVNLDSSVTTNINKIKTNQMQSESRNITHIDSNINTRANVTTSNNNFSEHYVMFSDNLDRHLILTNHTITSDIKNNLNESDKRGNETGNELKGPNMYSSENIKLNTSSITINVTASPFDCSNYTRGKYADKKDCRKFYICVGKLQPLLGICPNNTVFSEINKQCTRNLSHCVRNNQFRCLFEGRFNDFFKDNVYYICVKNSINAFVRYKLQCLPDYHLNKVSVKCEKNIEIPSQSASSVSENSKINNDECTHEAPKIKFEVSKNTNSAVEHECVNEGQFPHAKDCNKYYVCKKIKNVYRRKIKKCASDEIYDKEKKKCVESDSSEC